MATGEELVSEDFEKMVLDVKKAAAKLNAVLECYSLKKYSANVLKNNKESWMKKIDDSMSSVTEFFLENQFLDKVPQWSQDETKKIVDHVNIKFTEFVTELDLKILGELSLNDISATTTRSGSVASQSEEAARITEIDVNIDHEKIEKDIKSLSAEFNKFEDWLTVESHEIEVGMNKIEGWQKRIKWKDDLFKMKKNVLKNKLAAAENTVNYLKHELENVVEAIEFENEA